MKVQTRVFAFAISIQDGNHWNEQSEAAEPSLCASLLPATPSGRHGLDGSPWCVLLHITHQSTAKYHHRLPEEELAFLMKMNVMEVRKSIARLRTDQFVKTEHRPERRRFDGKVINKIVYYVDYKAICDTVKYKVWKIQKHLRERSQNVISPLTRHINRDMFMW